VQVVPIKPTLKVPGSKHLKPKYDEPLLNFAFNFKLRRYDEARQRERVEAEAERRREKADLTVGWCKLTLSNPS